MIAEQMTQAAAEMLELVVAGWLAVDTPSTSESCSAVDGELVCEGAIGYLRAYTNWAVAAIAVGAVLVAAIKLALDRDGREAGSVGKGLVALVVLAGAGVPAVRYLIEIGDQYSTWILNAAADNELGERLIVFATPAAISPMMTIGISLMLFLATMVQLLLLLARNAGLILLSGLLPLAAAAGISGSGRSVRDRYLTWLIALVLYKPAAATIYATVFWLIGEGQSITEVLTGLVMFIMAVVALPALMRLIAPPVGVLSGGGGGGAAVAAVAGAGKLTTGALRLADRPGKGSGQQSGGGGRPNGADPGTPHPAPQPSSGGTGTAASTGTTAAAAGTQAGRTAAATSTSSTAAAGAAGAAGPAGLAAGAGVAAAKAGPAAVRRVGGTASGAIDGEHT
ncbi:hypothetical protein [Salinispora sp. H7-4]|uniref:hypothetical protein n=1 Tax=Salinispora sp. H7-4 TaxID=2748321 RepID=UPI0021048682|nr:hypothetical protein [Salinispora sp. H7-4]